MSNSSSATPPLQSPTYYGLLSTPLDAILLLAACDVPWPKWPNAHQSQRGAQTSSSPSVSVSTSTSNTSSPPVPPPRRISRRLMDHEKSLLIRSGNVFVFCEDEAQMRRWTDGRIWSASRVNGSFLTYKELEAKKRTPITNPETQQVSNSSQNVYREEGLIKQSYSTRTASGRKLHIISYFTKRDADSGRLMRVSKDPRFVGEGGGEWNLKVDEAEYKTNLSSLAESDDLVFNPNSQPYPDLMEEEELVAHEQVRLTPVGRSLSGRDGSEERQDQFSQGRRERLQVPSQSVYSSRTPQSAHQRTRSDAIRTFENDPSALPGFLNDRRQPQQPPSLSQPQYSIPSNSWDQSYSSFQQQLPSTSDPRPQSQGSTLPSSQSHPPTSSWTSRRFDSANSDMSTPYEATSSSRPDVDRVDTGVLNESTIPSPVNRERGSTITQRPSSLIVPSADSSEAAMASVGDSSHDRREEDRGSRLGSISSLLRPKTFRTFSSSSHLSQPFNTRSVEVSGLKLYRTQSLEDRSKSSGLGKKRSADVDLYLESKSEDINYRPSVRRIGEYSRSPSTSPISQSFRLSKVLKTSSYGSSSMTSSGNVSTSSFRSLISPLNSTPNSSANQSTTSLSPGNSHKSIHMHQNHPGLRHRSGSEERWKYMRERESSDQGSEPGSVGIYGSAGGSAVTGDRFSSPSLSVGSLSDIPNSAPSSIPATAASSPHLELATSLNKLRTGPPSDQALYSSNKMSSIRDGSSISFNHVSGSGGGGGGGTQIGGVAVNSLREGNESLPSFSSETSAFDPRFPTIREDSSSKPALSPYPVPARSATDSDVLNRLGTRF